jgi:sugar lactone lactonase YvrE
VCTIAGTGVSGYHDTGNSAGEPPTFSYPNGLTFDAGGTLYVTENGNNVVRRLRGVGETLIVDTLTGQNRTVVGPERQEKLNATKTGIDGFRDGDSSNAAFRLPDDIIAAPDGSLYVADPNNHSIRRITNVEGDVRVETIAGNGVPGYADGTSLAARFNTPMALALSLDGNFLFVADMNNRRIRRIDLVNKQVDTLSGSGEIDTIDGPATEAAFLRPIGLALDSDGTLYVAELEGNIIRRVDSAGSVTTLAGDPDVQRFRDGGGLRATFNLPRGLAIDRVRGILYVADYENFRIRSIALR